MRKREHSYKPNARLIGKAPYHLGIELEVEAPDNDSEVAGLQLLPDRNRLAYAKCDGSLDAHGWELVTHPIAPDLWLKEGKPVARIKKLVEALQGLGYRSHDGGHCGLHVHISACAFRNGTSKHCSPSNYRYRLPAGYRPSLDGFRSTHAYYFWRLVNGPVFRALSQRRSFSFCQQTDNLSVRKFSAGAHDRYVACNFTTHTVEVRIFRGNLRWERVKKALESCIAAVEFTRGLTSRNALSGQSMEDQFVAYVVAHKKAYPNLHSYLQEVGLVRSSDLADVSLAITTTTTAEVC